MLPLYKTAGHIDCQQKSVELALNLLLSSMSSDLTANMLSVWPQGSCCCIVCATGVLRHGSTQAQKRGQGERMVQAEVIGEKLKEMSPESGGSVTSPSGGGASIPQSNYRTNILTCQEPPFYLQAPSSAWPPGCRCGIASAGGPIMSGSQRQPAVGREPRHCKGLGAVSGLRKEAQ